MPKGTQHATNERCLARPQLSAQENDEARLERGRERSTKAQRRRFVGKDCSQGTEPAVTKRRSSPASFASEGLWAYIMWPAS